MRRKKKLIANFQGMFVEHLNLRLFLELHQLSCQLLSFDRLVPYTIK